MLGRPTQNDGASRVLRQVARKGEPSMLLVECEIRIATWYHAKKRRALGALGNTFTSRSTFLGENCSLARPLCEAAPSTGRAAVSTHAAGCCDCARAPSSC